MEEVRPISIEYNLLPRAHGSALFTRGETQVNNIYTYHTSIPHLRRLDLKTLDVIPL